MSLEEEKELADILGDDDDNNASPEYRSHSSSRPSSIDRLMNELKQEEDEDKKTESGYNQWSTSDLKTFRPSSSTLKALIPGVYEIKSSPNIGIFFEKIPVRTEGLVRFDDSNSDRVIIEIQNFWDKEALFKKYNLIYKRGIILWGPPGSGKSCTIQLIMEDVIKRNGVVLRFTDPYLFIDGMRILRSIQPDTPIVVLMEDIDSIISENSESEVLNILDGVNEVYKTVFLATTNYPKQLGKRIICRPSRFDKRFKIGPPDRKNRLKYLQHVFQNDLHGQDLEQWADDTDKFSIAHLKELFVAVIILGDNYEEALEILRDMKEDIKDDDDKNKIGFNV